MVSRVFFALFLLMLGACASRPGIVLYPEAAGVGKVKSIYVSTTRKEGDNGLPGRERSESSSYFRYDISVPPDRIDGNINTSKTRIDPNTDFVATSAVRYQDKPSFQSDLNRALLRLPPNSRNTVIYVHGFNNTFDESILRLAQLANDFDFKGVSVAYSWPSAARVLEYEYDRDSQLFARDGLEELINTVRKAGADNVLLFAHSMGSQLVMEALRQIAIESPGAAARNIDAVVLISPDIDVGVFKTQARRIGELPNPFYIFISHEDQLLKLASLVSGEKSRVGNIDDVDDLSEFDVRIVDVTEFSSGLGHNAPGDSPTLIGLLNNLDALSNLFENTSTGLASAFVLTVSGATDIILSPVTDVEQ
ncbi:MAG: alpha/beta hydrolase [Paracoccaceae bacterium]